MSIKEEMLARMLEAQGIKPAKKKAAKKPAKKKAAKKDSEKSE